MSLANEKRPSMNEKSPRSPSWCHVLMYSALFAVATAVVLLRLFGVLFFGSTASVWALVPAIVLIGLMVLPYRSQPVRGRVAVVLALAYLASLYFYSWRFLMADLAEGGNVAFEATEAIAIGILVALCVRKPA